jgi:hypothetical protein
MKCAIKQTSLGSRYVHWLTYDNLMQATDQMSFTKLSSEEVAFEKNDTFISVRIHANSQTPISDEEWSKMIDSFQPRTFDGLQVRHMYPGP